MSYRFDSFVNKSEADALKKMIFERARMRSQYDNEQVQSEIMELARDSFVSKNNPFSEIVDQAAQKTDPKLSAKTEKEVEKVPEGIGFKQRELKSRAIEQARVVKESAEISAIQNTMIEARASLANKKTFVGALNFINSQAAVSLMRTRGDKFEVVV